MWIDSTRLDQFCKPLVPKNWPIQLGMSHIFSITLRWARPGSCAGDHRYQKVLTTVRSAVSREIHAPRRKEVNWRKNSTISYILSWCLGRVDISIVMIYLDILLIILDTVNNNHIIPINTIYIYIHISVCVCVCLCVCTPPCPSFQDVGMHHHWHRKAPAGLAERRQVSRR